MFFYAAGSYRKADDASQLFLLRLSLALSLLLGIAAFYGLVLDLYYTIRRRRAAYLWGVLGYILIICSAALVLLGSAFIIGAAGGNR
ncbi:MAG: hypothetical protein LBD31_09880 [Treponema sp.]|nr:hypothetical protein [Treponema sp.]